MVTRVDEIMQFLLEEQQTQTRGRPRGHPRGVTFGTSAFSPEPLAAGRDPSLWKRMQTQFRAGITDPVVMGLQKLGYLQDRAAAPSPETWGEWLAYGVGGLIGWVGPGLLASTVSAPIGAGLIGARLLPALGLAGRGLKVAQSASRLGVAGAATGAYAGWAQDEDSMGIAREAVVGGLLGAAFPVAGEGLSRVRRSQPVVDAIESLKDTMFSARHGAEALPATSMSRTLQLIRGTPSPVADDLLRQVERRIAERNLPLPSSIAIDDTGHIWGRGFENLRPQEQLSVITRLLAKTPETDSALKPVFRYVNQIGRGPGRSLGIDSMGSPLSPDYQRTLNLLGDTPAAPALPRTYQTREWRSLADQIKDIDEQVARTQRANAQLLETKQVFDPKDLRGADLDKWIERTRRLDELNIARNKLMPAVEEALGQANAGLISTSFAKALQEDLRQIRQETMTPIQMPHRRLYEVLEKHGVGSYNRLPMAGKAEYSTIRKQLLDAGESLQETIGWSLNPLNISNEDAQAMRRAHLAMPDVKLPSTLEEAILSEPLGFWDRWLAPTRKVLGEAIMREIRTADIQMKRTTSAYLHRGIHETLKPFLGQKNQQAREDIYWVLLGQKKQGDVSEQVWEAAKKMRQLFNKAGKEFGIPADRFLDDYVPRIRQAGSIEGALGRTPPDEIRWFAEEVRNGYLHPRETDIVRLWQAYVRGGAKRKYLEPVFSRLDVRMAQPDVHQNRQWYYDRMKERMLGLPSDTEQMLDNTVSSLAKRLFGLDTKGRHTRQISSFIIELQYAGTLGFNPFTAVKNLTQQILSVAHLDSNPMVGVDYWWKARQALLTPRGREMAAWNPLMTSSIPLEAMEHQVTAFQNIPGLGKLHEQAFKLFQASHTDNVNVSFMMRLLKSLDEGTAVKQAVEEAYSFTMATQFMYGIDSPLLYHGPLSRQLGVLLSWPMNWAQLLKDQVTSPAPMRAVSMLGLMSFGAEALSLTGLNFRSISPVETAKGLLPWAMLEGEREWPITLQATYASGDLMRQMVAGDPEAQERALENWRRAMIPLVPYSTQVKRMLNTWEAWQNDWKMLDDQQRLRYDMARQGPIYDLIGAPGEAIRGFIGPTTEQSERYHVQQLIRRQQNAYVRERRRAIEAFIDGDIVEFMKLQQHLMVMFGRPIQMADIERERQLRELPAHSRQAMSLPAELRQPLLESLGIPDPYEREEDPLAALLNPRRRRR